MPDTPNNIENNTTKDLENYQEETKDLLGDVNEYLIGRKEIHHTFCDYAKEILSPEEQKSIIDTFGENDEKKDIDTAINHFLNEKRTALKASATKDKEHPDGDQTLLNNLNLTMLFLGNPTINGLLNNYYDDFVSIREAKPGSERNAIKSKLLIQYDITKKKPEEKIILKKKIEEEFTKTNDTNNINNANNKQTRQNTYTTEPKIVDNGSFGDKVSKLPDKPFTNKFKALAKSQIGNRESNGTADKYLSEIGRSDLNSKTTPRCGAFVSWLLQKSGCPYYPNLSAKAFIGKEGLGHVGVKVDGKIISGNYGNKVSSDIIDKPIVGYAIPSSSGITAYKESININEVPEGAIVVFDRGSKRKNAA